MDLAGAIEIFALVTGLAYVVLEIGQRNFMWVVGILTGLACAYSFATQRLWASMGLNVYYVIISFWGLWKWRRDARLVRSSAVLPGSDSAVMPGPDPVVMPGSDPAVMPGPDPAVMPGPDPAVMPGTDPAVMPGPDPAAMPGPDPAVMPGSDRASRPAIHLRRPTRKTLILSALLTLFGTAALIALLRWLGDSSSALDAFVTVLSAVATWWLALSYPQQWILWIVADILSTILCALSGLPWMAALYLAYAASAVYGYFHWTRNGIYVA